MPTDILLVSRGMRYEFLPPYSPDYNPIELAFSAMKYNLRRQGDYIRMAMTELSNMEVYGTLLEGLCQCSDADVFGWFRHCGYV
jgi:DDE superfamily endonuclease